MLTELRNAGAIFGRAASALPALPGSQEHEEFVLVHSAWTGWYYEKSSKEAAAPPTWG